MKLSLGLLRITLGFIFFWAFLDKLFGLGYATPAARAWISGGSPTAGFLKSASGQFSPLFNNLSGQIWVDWLFMAGLFGIGIALILGIGMRIATYTGSLLLLLMFLAAFPTKTNPFVDEHIIYILVLWVLLLSNAGNNMGFEKAWRKTSLVKRFPILQ